MIETIHQGFLLGAYGASVFFGFTTLLVGGCTLAGLVVGAFTGFFK